MEALRVPRRQASAVRIEPHALGYLAQGRATRGGQHLPGHAGRLGQARQPPPPGALRHPGLICCPPRPGHHPLHHRPRPPEAPGQEGRQHPPRGQARCAEEHHHRHRPQAPVSCGGTAHPPLTPPMDVQRSPAAPALLGPVRRRVAHPGFVLGEVHHRLIDERPALLPPRRVAQNKASICRRWGGPSWVHEASEVFANLEVPQLRRRFNLALLVPAAQHPPARPRLASTTSSATVTLVSVSVVPRSARGTQRPTAMKPRHQLGTASLTWPRSTRTGTAGAGGRREECEAGHIS